MWSNPARDWGFPPPVGLQQGLSSGTAVGAEGLPPLPSSSTRLLSSTGPFLKSGGGDQQPWLAPSSGSRLMLLSPRQTWSPHYFVLTSNKIYYSEETSRYQFNEDEEEVEPKEVGAGGGRCVQDRGPMGT